MSKNIFDFVCCLLAEMMVPRTEEKLIIIIRPHFFGCQSQYIRYQDLVTKLISVLINRSVLITFYLFRFQLSYVKYIKMCSKQSIHRSQKTYQEPWWACVFEGWGIEHTYYEGGKCRVKGSIKAGKSGNQFLSRKPPNS